MNKEIEYWKWKSTIIDFDNISDEKDEYGSYATKKDIVFHYLGTPDNDIHEWYNGGFSSEYNTALRYAKQLGLVEDYIDYEEELYTLQQENEELHNKFKKVINIINVDGYDCKNRDEFEKVLGKLLIELNISCKNKQKN